MPEAERALHAIPGALSGPLLDRIDLVIEVPAVTAADLIRRRPRRARRKSPRGSPPRGRSRRRYAALGVEGVSTNAACPAPLLEQVAQPDRDGLALIREAADKMRLSARGFHRVLKVARTLADLDGEERVRRIHLAGSLVLPRTRRPPLGRGVMKEG